MCLLFTGKGRGWLSALEPREAEGYARWGQKQAETKSRKALVWDFISSPLRSHWSAGFGHISHAAFVGISPASPCGVECVAVARGKETCELLTVSLGRGGLQWQRRRT